MVRGEVAFLLGVRLRRVSHRSWNFPTILPLNCGTCASSLSRLSLAMIGDPLPTHTHSELSMTRVNVANSRVCALRKQVESDVENDLERVQRDSDDRVDDLDG